MSDKKIHYIKSFSKGQITLPKVIRDSLGLGNDFWLKIYEEKGKIVAEPAESTQSRLTYLEKLKEIKGGWYDETEWKALRQQSQNREKLD